MVYKTCMYGVITLYDRVFQRIPFHFICQRRVPITPKVPKHLWFGLLPGRSPLLGESLLFSSPAGT